MLLGEDERGNQTEQEEERETWICSCSHLETVLSLVLRGASEHDGTTELAPASGKWDRLALCTWERVPSFRGTWFSCGWEGATSSDSDWSWGHWAGRSPRSASSPTWPHWEWWRGEIWDEVRAGGGQRGGESRRGSVCAPWKVQPETWGLGLVEQRSLVPMGTQKDRPSLPLSFSFQRVPSMSSTYPSHQYHPSCHSGRKN